VQIILARHGESLGNVDQSAYLSVADHAMPLSPLGHQQAGELAGFLGDWTAEHWGDQTIRIWHSPYLRAAQTAEPIITALGDRVEGVREHILLAEQQFGLFDGLTDDEVAARYPAEWEHFQRCVDFDGKFWARNPQGESRFDVATRVHQSFGTFHRDAARHGIDHLIIVCHGTTMRAFVMMWLHLPVSWFEAEPNPPNCAAHLLVDDVDHGLIYATS
jgi:2,3-bisphosphoglycerate-dependent phosphoglycerate mutase